MFHTRLIAFGLWMLAGYYLASYIIYQTQWFHSDPSNLAQFLGCPIIIFAF